jgi:hypothetical protein
VDCGTGPAEVPICSIAPGAQFKVLTYLNSFPVGVLNYAAYDTVFEYQGVTSKPVVTHEWPDCALVAGPVYFSSFVATGCSSGVGAPPSTYTGLILKVTFTCTANGSVALAHDVGKTTLYSASASSFIEGAGTQDLLTINCNAAASTPTPTPPSVGGSAVEPQGGSTAFSLVPMLIDAAVLLAAATGVSLGVFRRRIRP